MLDQLLGDGIGGLHGDGEAQALIAAGGIEAAAVLQRVDADQVALVVEQAAAGVAAAAFTSFAIFFSCLCCCID